MINPWIILILGAIIGGFLGYASSMIMAQNIMGYMVIVAVILMFILGRLSSPKRVRRMPYNRAALLYLLSGIVFGYGMILLLLFVTAG